MSIMRLDRYKPSVFGKGYLGEGNHPASIDKVLTKAYRVWHSMLLRCYDDKYHKQQPTYKDCSVCDEWLNFQSFAKWFDTKYIPDYHLDKDIRIKDNKVYSPDTCLFVPQWVNNLLKPNAKPKEMDSGRFWARYGVDGKDIALGTFDTYEEASKVIASSKTEYLHRKIHANFMAFPSETFDILSEIDLTNR